MEIVPPNTIVYIIDEEYWFAKDIGPIKEFETINDGVTNERTLIDYVLN